MTRVILFLVFLMSMALLAAQVASAQPVAPEQNGARLSRRALLDDGGQGLPLTPLARVDCDENGMAEPYPCHNVDLLAYMPLKTFESDRANDSWGWTDPVTGKEYAILGLYEGTAFVDISDPENPALLGTLPSHSAPSIWRDVKTYANHAFIVSEADNHGMQVFDLTRLRAVSDPPVDFDEDAHYELFDTAHNIAINEETGYAYIVGSDECSGGPHIINIQDPTIPVFAGCLSEDGFTHDAQCVVYDGPDADHRGREICFNSNEDTLTIVDVSDKSSPTMLSRSTYAGAGYVHQGWLSEDHRYFLSDDELDEQTYGHNTHTYLWDVGDLDAPVLVSTYIAPVGAIDHNQYIRDGYSFQANYRSGLRILDLADVANGNLQEIAFFDIYPTSDSADYNGAWNVYPFYDSGVVTVSGIEQGLFILQPQLPPDYIMRAEKHTFAICGDGSDSSAVSLLARNQYTGAVNLTSEGLPAGVTAQFEQTTLTPPGSTTLNLSASAAAPGLYPFSIEASDGMINRLLNLQLHVAATVPAVPALLEPSDNSVQPTLPTFRWAPGAGALTYDLEIARDVHFADVVLSVTNLSTTTYTPATPLPQAQILYWRVRAANACGAGVYAEPARLNTMICAPQERLIPDDELQGVSSDIVLNSDALVGDVDVFVEAEHSRVGDLIFRLEHIQTGTIVTLVDRPGYPQTTAGCTGAGVDVFLDDDEPGLVENACQSGTPALSGRYQPQEPLQTFAGEPLSGTWRLTAIDDAATADGSLVQWCIGSTTLPAQQLYLPVIQN